MSHAKSAETFARQVAAKTTAEQKLDAVARSLVELAMALHDIEVKVACL
jgi:hypothetical protein